MRKKYILFVFILSLLMPVSFVWACNCNNTGSTRQEFNKYDAVFLGMVLEVKPAGAIRPGYNLIRLRPIKVYKGGSYLPNPDVITVFTPDTKKECGATFNKRIDYLIFAEGYPAFMKVNSCSRTGIQEDKKEELKVLEEIYKKSVKNK